MDDLPSLHQRMVEAGVAVLLEPTQKPRGLCAEYADPDGNTVFVSG